MLDDADVDHFFRDLAGLCARHGVTLITSCDGRAKAVMRGHEIDLEDGRLDAEIGSALRAADPGAGSPATFFG